MRVNTNKGCFVISVSAGKGCYRHIRIPANKKLSYLAEYILDCFEFDHDHLYSFFMNNRLWDSTEEYAFMPEDPYTNDASVYKLSDLDLEAGKQFKFLYDYGDEWEFQCKVLRAENSDDKKASVLKSVGEPPCQYGMYDDEEDDYYDDDDDEDCCDDFFYEEESEDEYFPNAYRIISDDLLEAAIDFRKKAAQRKSYFSQPFALKLSNGKTGYCVYNTDADAPTVYLFVGETGWKMFSRYYQSGNEGCDEADFPDDSDALCCNYVGSDGMTDEEYEYIRNRTAGLGYSIRKFPFFTYRKALHVPWELETENQVVLMTEAMKALNYVFSNYRKYSALLSNGLMFGRLLYLIPDKKLIYRTDEREIPAHVSFDDYPSPAVKMKKLPLKGEWICDICTAPDWVTNHADPVPHLLKALVMIRTDKNASYQNMTFDEASTYERIVEQTVREFERLGYYPELITVRNERTLRLISSFCRDAGVKTELTDELPEIDEALSYAGASVPDGSSDFSDTLNISGSSLRENLINQNPEFGKMLMFMEKMMLECSESELRTIVGQDRGKFRGLYEMNVFSEDVQKRIAKVLNVK